MNDFLATAKAVAKEAGSIMLESFGLDTVHTLKEDHSPITEADRRINAMVIERLEAQFPEHSLLGEEGEKLHGNPLVWVFDPIDGTAPYLRGIPTNVFSLALVENGEPILGVVYDPYMKRLYHAIKGRGAYLNDVLMHTSARVDLARTYTVLATARGYTDLAYLEHMREQEIRFFKYGSAVYGHMLVASGQVEGTILSGGKPWDAAAAKIIIEEAGGITSDIHGNVQRYDGKIAGFVAAGTPEYHRQLLALIAPSLPQND